MPEQEQFLQVLDRHEAERRFRAAVDCTPRFREVVSLDGALGRVLADDVVSSVDVPSFDRSNVDGFAAIAADTFGASEAEPRVVSLIAEEIRTGVVPPSAIFPGKAVSIATGGMVPRGADAVIMVEHCGLRNGDLLILRAVSAGSNISFAGTDITAGETVLRAGQWLTSRDTGVLAAIGIAQVTVWRKPVVAILSTGDEIIAPGEQIQAAQVYDSNGQILADATRELGGEPRRLGIVPDNEPELRKRLRHALTFADVVLLSGGTSKGVGDVSYRVVSELTDPGIVAHGVALKPGKPLCLAATRGRAVVVLPGFPTSAIFTFHEFVAPLIRMLGGRGSEERTVVPARLAVKVNSEIGRTEFLLVSLVAVPDRDEAISLAAYPMGQGSGSVTSFSHADGFATIGRHHEILEAGTAIDVQLLGSKLQIADLVVIGSHCIGLDSLLGTLQQQGIRSKFLAVGSSGGLEAVKRGECDLAGVHLLDPTGEYNRPFLTPELDLIAGYGRLQGIVFRPGDTRFERMSAREAIAKAVQDPACVMVNRNNGSGTRVLIDRLLRGAKPPGYAVQPRNHNATAAAVKQGRADWGMTLETIARNAGLGFLPVQAERYDFIVPRARDNRPGVVAFRTLLQQPSTRAALERLGMTL